MHFYSLDKVISYNIPVNIIITERGYGKSFSVKDYVIKKYKKDKSEFLYLRRYENELKEVFEVGSIHKGFFSDIKEKYPKDELQAKNKKFYINNEVMGYAKRMTEAQDLKSSGYSNVKTIIIDEYPIEKGKRYYLPSEGMLLMGIFDSIIRNRSDVKIFILGNAVEGLEYSPLFTFFDLSLPYGKKDIKLFKENTILVQYATNSEFRIEREQTLIGKLAKGTPYEQYAIQNKILDKNNDFLSKKSGTATFVFSFIYQNEQYGIWNDLKEGKVIVSKNIDPYNPFVYAVTLKDQRPNTLLISRTRSYRDWKFLIEQYRLSNVYYESQKIKKIFTDVIKLYIG